MPERLWQEILFDFNAGAVIDLTPADGLLAMAELHARIAYTGLVFTRKHADDLLQRTQSFAQPCGSPHTFKAEAETGSQNKHHCTDRCQDKAENEGKGKAFNKMPSCGKAIQDGCI